jgi:gamma-glutamyltranspeptidase/glutathione hydrolase
MRIIFAWVFTTLLLVACRTTAPQFSGELTIQKTAFGDNGGIASAHPAASAIGLYILKEGGNAVDAAIATQFALAVCYPVAGNIGGGGFMMVRFNDGTTDALDFRETAPGDAHRDMYLDEDGNVIEDLSTSGHLAVGVPGSVDGMVKAFNKYSRLKDWKKLVQPSVNLARNGVVLTAREARSLNRYRDRFLQANTRPQRFTKDESWQKGQLLKQPELASVMEAIRDHGREGFYEGWVADSIVAEMQRGGGIIHYKDLASYNAKWRTPISGTYQGYEVHSMPPPSSGGIALIQLLNSVDSYPLDQWGFQSPETIHLMVEAERRVYADRATHLGDSDFYPVPITELVTKAYSTRRMSDVSPSTATSSKEVSSGSWDDTESEETTHFSIVDGEGNAVSVTTTINTGFGSKVVVGGAGFFLNNEMDDFSAKPGIPNFFGLVGNEANQIEPGKRMLSSMTPTIVSRDGNLVLVVGTPGGSTIITSVFQVVLNVLTFDQSASQAVSACRFHHQWLPDNLQYETNCLDESVKTTLSNMGHHLVPRSGSGRIGAVEAILIRQDGTIEVAADPRNDDTALAY